VIAGRGRHHRHAWFVTLGRSDRRQPAADLERTGRLEVSSLKTMSAPRPEAGVIGVGERKRRTTSPAAESVSASGKVTVRMHTVSPRRARPVRRPSSGWHLRNGYACNS